MTITEDKVMSDLRSLWRMGWDVSLSHAGWRAHDLVADLSVAARDFDTLAAVCQAVDAAALA